MVKKGSTSNAIVEYVDIVPTFIDIAQGEPIAPIDGKSFRAVLEGKTKKHKKYSFSLQTTRGVVNGSDYYGVRSVTDGKYRYIINLTPEATFINSTTKNSKAWQEWLEEAAKGNEHAITMTTRFQKRPAMELYNVKKDPYCINNLIDEAKYKKKVAELSKELYNWMEYCGDKGQQTEMEALNHVLKSKKNSKK